MAGETIRAFYVASTHWDREWYMPFQHYRYHLVELLDEVLDLMARDARFTCFQTDGQSIILEDYLEVRPERAEQVQDFALAGRLRIGPWYTMPDENIVAPESLIRNLEEGIRVARAFGNVSKVGFVCDIFGHVSQLPQILNGFGIESAFVFRGVNEDTHRGLFRWQSPDGSEVVTHRFGPKEGYFDYGAVIRKGFDHAHAYTLNDAVPRLAEYVKIQRERTGLDLVLLFDGGDHMPIEPSTSDLLDGLRRALPGLDVRHTGLDEFGAAMVARRGQIPRLVQGELRTPGRISGDGAYLIPGVLSSRIGLKQANRACETALGLWAEPFSHLAGRLTGLEYPHGFLRRAWRYVLENHAHDSICGCSPDQVHKDMEFRFDQARLISDKLTTVALEAIATRVDLPDLAGEDFAMVLFNPTQADLDGPVEFELWFPEKTKNLFAEFFHYEWKVGFRLYDAAGSEIPYDFLGHAPKRRRFTRVHRKVPLCEECIVVRVAAPLWIPAFGYTTVVCTPVAAPTRHPGVHIVSGDRALENERLRVEVQANGALRVYDKHTGQTYDRLLVFEERADIGDGWFHGVAANDQLYSSAACAADVAVVEDGVQQGALRITTRMQVPEAFEFESRMRRSERKVPLLIDSTVTLQAGADHLDVRTVIDNQVRDHRVRVLFESGATADTYLADSAFDVVERKISLPPDNHTYKELAVETTPHANWTAVFDARRGLAVVAPGLPETAVRDVPERTLALTLLRGFRRTVFTDGEEGGQSLGHHAFDYRLVFLAGEPPRARLAALGQRTAAGIRVAQVLPRNQAPKADRMLAKALAPLVLRPGEAVLTSFRRRPDANDVEVRLFNPHATPVRETLAFAEAPVSAALVDLEGRTLGELPVRAGGVEVPMAPKRIATVVVRFVAG